MGKAILLILLFSLVLGCAELPAKSNTPLAPFKKLLVRDINWKETAVSEIEGDNLKEYLAAQPRLSALFRTEFGKYIKDIHFFEQVDYGDGPADAETIILEPKIYTIKADSCMPGADYTGLLKTADGRLVGKYTSERRIYIDSKPIANIEKLIGELAEDAASLLPYAR